MNNTQGWIGFDCKCGKRHPTEDEWAAAEKLAEKMIQPAAASGLPLTRAEVTVEMLAHLMVAVAASGALLGVEKDPERQADRFATIAHALYESRAELPMTFRILQTSGAVH